MEVLTESAAVVAAGDASATRTVYGVVAALAAIGVALVALAVWLIKQTRPERELLAPLERMQDRSWRKKEPAQKRRDLDEVRPADARPVVREQDVPAIDDEFAQTRPALATFDDLQAQLAADARRSPGAADPLMAPRVAADSGRPDGADRSDGRDAGSPDAVADGAVTHRPGGSADIAALVGSLDDRPADGVESRSPADGAESSNDDADD